MGRIFLIRHPSTERERKLPASEWRLSREGERQLERLIREPFWEGVRHVYSSPEPKAEAVARAAFVEHAIPYSAHSELAELRRPPGLIDDYRERVKLLLRRPRSAPEGWETVASAAERAWAFLNAVVTHGPLPAAVVSHGIVLSAVRAKLLGQERADPRDWLAMPFAAVAEVESEGWVLVCDFCD
jgi:broad specificity phosphatase PhoE